MAKFDMNHPRLIQHVQKLLPIILMGIGFFLIAFSLLIDHMRSGDVSRVFGWKQLLLLLIGIGVASSGVWAAQPARMKLLAVKVFSINNFPSFCAVILGLYWWKIIGAYGLELSPDSTNYLTYALKMYTGYDYSVPPIWPPLYPILINLLMIFNPFPAESAVIVSGLSMMLLLLVFVLTMHEFRIGPMLSVLLLVLLFTFSRMLIVFEYAWSEGPFAAFCATAFFFVVRHYKTNNIIHYIFAALFVSLAVITRYVGFALIFTLGMYTVFFLYSNNIKRFDLFFKYLVAYSFSFVPILLYILNNYISTGTLLGPRIEAKVSLYRNLFLLVDVLRSDIGLPLGIMLTIALAIFGIRVSKIKVRAGSETLVPLSFLLVFLLSYLSFIVYTTSSVAVDGINTRYFSPIYPLMVLFIAISFIGEIRENGFDEKISAVYAHFFAVLFHGLVLITLFMNIADFGAMLNETSVKLLSPIGHLTTGFIKSSTNRELNAYFRQIMEKEGRIYLSSLSEHTLHPPRPHLGRALLFRESVFTISSDRQISFHDLHDKQGQDITDFTLSYSRNGKMQSILYRNLPPVNDTNHLINELREVMLSDDVESLYLTVLLGEMTQIGRGLEEDLPEDFELLSHVRIAPYDIYHIKLNNTISFTLP
jgi:hypothetical protein